MVLLRNHLNGYWPEESLALLSQYLIRYPKVNETINNQWRVIYVRSESI